ncbi:MAG: hypothetical protein KDI34_11710 [Halioglobus sp.]|nr:hypothetical protein [Halioglobus sp.]
MESLELAKSIIRSCLQLGEGVPLDRDTYLMGGFPEFNSLTITTMIVQIEETLGCEIMDDEITGDIFESVGSLADFIAEKSAQA